jgi:hypothetical protein
MNYYVQSVMFYKNICVQNVQNKSCGHLKKAWRAKKYPRALGWAPLTYSLFERSIIKFMFQNFLSEGTINVSYYYGHKL